MENKRVFILINTIDKVKRFVQIVTAIDCDIDVKSGRHLIDAKSIMGLFALDLSHPVELKILSDDKLLIDHIIDKIGDFIVVCDCD